MTTQNSTALTTIDPASSALAGLGLGDEPLKPTNLILLQRNHADEDETRIPGRFLDAQSNMQFQNLNVVVLSMQDGRVLFPPGGYQKDVKPLCRSNDGKSPIRDNPDLVCQDGGHGCRKCFKSQWSKVGGRSIKPECQETLSLLLAEVETGFIYRFNAKGTAVKPAKDLRDSLRKTYELAKSKGAFLPPYAVKVTLGQTKIQGQRGTYYIPKFTITGEVDPEKRQEFQELYSYFVLGSGRTEDPETSDPVSQVLEGEYEPTTQYAEA